MRVIIYGDIHGCLDEFVALRKKLEITQDDIEFSVGDVVDRGLNSVETLRYIKDNNILMILGNHEYKHLRYYKREIEQKLTGFLNNVKLDNEQAELYKQFSQEDFEFLESLPFYRKYKNLVVMHGGLPLSVNLNEPTLKGLETSLWIRKIDKDTLMPISLFDSQENGVLWGDVYDGSQGIVVYGHSPMQDVLVHSCAIGIDTSCVFGNKLTAAVFDRENISINNVQFVHQNANKQYAQLKIFN